ncbi:IclR family transcriptional regulator [Rhodococcus erythropolis]|uniref:IclR family transcriptional regulator n=1 Tax=Rhodococcus erythropolis TaxID=1833 RepID=UPI00381CEBCB
MTSGPDQISPRRHPAASTGRETRSLLNGLTLLQAVAQHQPIGVGDLSRVLGVPKSSAQRSLLTLESEGWLQRADAHSRWQVGPSVFALTGVVGASADLKTRARPAMQWLVEQLNETIHLTVPVPASRSAVLVERVECDQVIRSMHPIGTAFPMHCTAAGKALLAVTGQGALEHYLEQPLERYTDRTITDADLLRKELTGIPTLGYALNIGENTNEVASFAAPVFDMRGQAEAAIAVSMPRARYVETDAGNIGQLVAEAARRASCTPGIES